MADKEIQKFLNSGYQDIKGDLVSPFKVMRSAAGYYIGRTYIDKDCYNAEFPYDRATGYFESEAFAQTILEEEF